MSAIYAWHLQKRTSTTVMIEVLLLVSSLPLMIRSRSKLSCVLQFKLSPLWVAHHALWQYPFPYLVHELGIWPQASIYNIYIYAHVQSSLASVGLTQRSGSPQLYPHFKIYTAYLKMCTPTLLETQRLQITPPILTLITPHTDLLSGFPKGFFHGGREECSYMQKTYASVSAPARVL